MRDSPSPSYKIDRNRTHANELETEEGHLSVTSTSGSARVERDGAGSQNFGSYGIEGWPEWVLIEKERMENVTTSSGEHGSTHRNLLTLPTTSQNARNSAYDEQLHQLLIGLQSFDLTGDLYEQSDHFNAHGGYCDVFKAKSKRYEGMDVAVKRLRVHAFGDKNVSKMIFRELDLWSKLRHRNILQLLGYAMYGEYPAMVSTWKINGSLRTYMKSNQVPLVQMTMGIANGLKFLHDKDIVHSDLKCDNVLVSDSIEPLLADFGISRMISNTSVTTGTSTKGSTRWMAIELWPSTTSDDDDEGKHTKKTDIWAFGMVIYELLTGHVPYYETKNDVRVSFLIARGQLPQCPARYDDKVPSERLLWTTCADCWESDPSDRPEIDGVCEVLSFGAKIVMPSDPAGRIENSRKTSDPVRPKSGKFDDRAMQSSRSSYPNQLEHQVTMNIYPTPPTSFSIPGSSASSSSLKALNVICSCDPFTGRPRDGHFITCTSCRRTFHMTCGHIHDNSPNFQCWTCQNQASRPHETRSVSQSESASSSYYTVDGGWGPSLMSNTVSGDRHPMGRRSDVSPYPYSSVNDFPPDNATGLSGSRNTETYPPSTSSQHLYRPPPHSLMHPPYSPPYSTNVNSGTSPNTAGRTNAGYNNASSSHSGPEIPSGVRVGIRPTAPTSQARNPEPCGYCQYHRVKCDIDYPFSKACCRQCHGQNFSRCPPVKKDPRY